MKDRRFLTVPTIVLVLALALVAGVQASGGLYAQSVLFSGNVTDPSAAVGEPDEIDATVGADGLWGGLMLDMGQQVCEPLYVYAPMDSVGAVFVNPCAPEDVSCTDYGGIGFLSDEQASSYDEVNQRWVIHLYDATPDVPGAPPYTGTIRTVAIDNYWGGASLISVDAVEASPCGTQPQPEFGGFLPPIASDALNKAKAGRAVPVKFSLGGDFGLDILESTSVQFACDNEPVNPEVVETVSAGASSLTYDPDTDMYNYVWKTDQSWSGTCRHLSLTIDGQTYVADFQFN